MEERKLYVLQKLRERLDGYTTLDSISHIKSLISTIITELELENRSSIEMKRTLEELRKENQTLKDNITELYNKCNK